MNGCEIRGQMHGGKYYNEIYYRHADKGFICMGESINNNFLINNYDKPFSAYVLKAPTEFFQAMLDEGITSTHLVTGVSFYIKYGEKLYEISVTHIEQTNVDGLYVEKNF
jgi:hypothetical protein